jgi:hypothetical protein
MRATCLLVAVAALLAAAPSASADTLIDQTTPAGVGSSTAEEGASPMDYNGETADDVVVPAGVEWTVTGVQALGFNYGGRAAQPVVVRFYADASGLPGAETYKQTSTMSTVNPSFTIPLSTPAVLAAGSHWLSVQVAGSDGTPASEWFWLNRGAQSGAPAAFRNSLQPGVCSTWAVRGPCAGGGGPDQRFALTGTSGPPTAAAPATPAAPVTPSTAAPPGPAAAAPAAGKAVTFAALVALPSAKRCVSRRRISVKLAKVDGATVTRVTVSVSGRLVSTVTGNALRAPVDLRGLPSGRFAVKLTVTLSTGKTLTGKRTYRTCAVKAKRR